MSPSLDIVENNKVKRNMAIWGEGAKFNNFKFKNIQNSVQMGKLEIYFYLFV